MADTLDKLFDSAVKTCTLCKRSLALEHFYRCRETKDGRVSACKECAKIAKKSGPKTELVCARCSVIFPRQTSGAPKYCKDCSKEVSRERDRIRRPRTKVGKTIKCTRCEVGFIYKGGKQVACPECIIIVNAERGKRWASENKDRVLASAKRYNDKRRSTPRGHLEWTVRAAVRRAVADGSLAGRRTFELLGYTVDELKSHIEKQFKDGMTWDNYGDWHIDHRLPLASFEYTSPDCQAFKAAWAITNLQPLWAKDNMSKGAKRTYLI